MRVALLFLILGCSPSESPPGRAGLEPAGDTGAATTSTSPIERPLLGSPAEATDLDPEPGIVQIELTAAPHSYTVGEQQVDGWAYNGQVPGPTIRATVGDELVVRLTNDLPDPTTIHWHGLHVPWDMDGVVWMQDPVAPGDTFEYRFTLRQAGTFWYHPHFDTARQVDLGLYGVLVVEDPAEPLVDEAIWVFDTWGEDEAAMTMSGGHTHGPDATVRTWSVNTLVGPEWRPETGSVTRIRMLNASNTGYIQLEQLSAIGLDQGLLSEPTSGSLLLGPGDRAEVAWTATDALLLDTPPYAAAGGTAWGDRVELVSMVPTGADVADPIPSWPFDGAPPTPDPGTTDITWVLHGDGQASAWMINGEQFPDVTIPELATGAVGIIELRNLSAAEHPFHLHGMSFEVLSIDGEPPAHRTVEDTINVRIGSRVRLRVAPENPGDWMAHCHILPHAEMGMMTVLRVP